MKISNEVLTKGGRHEDQSKGDFVVHAEDCADCKKLRGEIKHTGEFESKLDVSRDIWSDMIHEGSMTAEDGLGEIHFAPCVVTKLPHDTK